MCRNTPIPSIGSIGMTICTQAHVTMNFFEICRRYAGRRTDQPWFTAFGVTLAIPALYTVYGCQQWAQHRGAQLTAAIAVPTHIGIG